MKCNKIITVLSGLLISASLFSQSGPHNQEVEIRDVRVNGTGCPIGTASVLLTNSHPNGPIDFFEIVYDEFIVERGPDATEKSRKFCNVVADIKFPQGWSYSIFRLEYEGYAEIARGAKAELKTEYFFPQVTSRKRDVKKIKGPWEGDYNNHDTNGIFTAIGSPCGRTIPLNIKTTLTLKGTRRSNSIITSDIQTGSITQKFGLKWKRCLF